MKRIPKQMLDKIEQRWASRLAREAATWRHDKNAPAASTKVVDQSGRIIPVTIRRSTHAERPR